MKGIRRLRRWTQILACFNEELYNADAQSVATTAVQKRGSALPAFSAVELNLRKSVESADK